MFCDECKKNPATVHVNTVHNGVHTEKNLCQDCAVKYGLMSFMPFSFGDLVPHAVLSEQDQIRCETCGMTLSEFKQGGLVGCQDCYRYLRAGTEPILRRVQKGLTHTGRRPVGHDAGKLPQFSSATPASRPAPTDPLSEEIAELQAKLDSAVKEENFELAASLRDEIRALQSQKGEVSQN